MREIIRIVEGDSGIDPAMIHIVRLQDGAVAYYGDPFRGGQKIGYAHMLKGDPVHGRENAYHIYKSFVEQPYRRLGIARRLYDACEASANARDGILVPATSVSDDAFAFWNSWKPDRIAYDHRHYNHLYVGKIVAYQGREWEIIAAANATKGPFHVREVGGKATNAVPRQVVFDQVGDFYPKTISHT